MLEKSQFEFFNQSIYRTLLRRKLKLRTKIETCGLYNKHVLVVNDVRK